jgi:hypothetical protein
MNLKNEIAFLTCSEKMKMKKRTEKISFRIPP